MEVYCDNANYELNLGQIPLINDPSLQIIYLDSLQQLCFATDNTTDFFKANYHLFKLNSDNYLIKRDRHTKTEWFIMSKSYPDGHTVWACKPNRQSRMIGENGQTILLILLLFLLSSAAFYAVAHQVGKRIQGLKKLVKRIESGDRYNFPDDEYKEVSEYIVTMYKNQDRTQKALNLEREKLRAHLKLSKRGLAIFTPNRKEILSNELYIQYVNLISDHQINNTEKTFDITEFAEITDFLDNGQCTEVSSIETKHIQINKNDVILLVNCILFADHSFEITIEDITAKEEQIQLKKQLTQNISHELKTPVSSIQGFMETLLNNPDMDEEKKQFYVQRSYSQAKRLSDLLQDISTLNKLDEASGMFAKDKLNLHDIVQGVLSDVALQLEEQHISTDVQLPTELPIMGNQSLLYSIFRNLVDNSIKYAGENIQIGINCYRSDELFYYFSVWDNGSGVNETHLGRIFDRFYRVDKGRSRKLGGTGLGLAIVKNAVLFHQGRISAKTHPGGGLEFLFTLRKESTSLPA